MVASADTFITLPILEDAINNGVTIGRAGESSPLDIYAVFKQSSADTYKLVAIVPSSKAVPDYASIDRDIEPLPAALAVKRDELLYGGPHLALGSRVGKQRNLS